MQKEYVHIHKQEMSCSELVFSKKAATNANYYKIASFLPLDGATLH